MNKTLVLCSGGPDGVVAAAHLTALGHDVTFLHFCYGQKAQARELKAMNEIYLKMNIPILTIQTDVFQSISSSLLAHVNPHAEKLQKEAAWVPARNLILLSIAAGIAESNDFNGLCIGNIAGGVYLDNQPAFTKRFNELLEYAVKPAVTIVAPLNHITKSGVMQMGVKYNVPLELTWSCYGDGELHCGECASCAARKKGFIVAGLQDPTRYAA